MAKSLYEELAEEISERTTFETLGRPLLIPIPLSSKRLRERGFNQCDLIVSALADLDKESFFETSENLLHRIRHTESQTKKSRAERLKNLKDCFDIPQPEKVQGRSIILLDDVTTTGATLEEASKELVKAGAKTVLKVALAH